MVKKISGYHVASESAKVVRERLVASGGDEVTIPVADSDGSVVIAPRNVARTTAVGKTPEGKMVLIILGNEDEVDTHPTILVGTVTAL